MIHLWLFLSFRAIWIRRSFVIIFNVTGIPIWRYRTKITNINEYFAGLRIVRHWDTNVTVDTFKCLSVYSHECSLNLDKLNLFKKSEKLLARILVPKSSICIPSFHKCALEILPLEINQIHSIRTVTHGSHGALLEVWDNFWQLIALQKWWKMFFISPQKLFSFSRYSSFCLEFLVM